MIIQVSSTLEDLINFFGKIVKKDGWVYVSQKVWSRFEPLTQISHYTSINQ